MTSKPSRARKLLVYVLIAIAVTLVVVAVAPAIAEEEPSVSLTDEQVEEILDEPSGDPGLTERVSAALKYVTKGDASDILSETETELSLRSVDLDAREAELAAEAESLKVQVEELNTKRAELLTNWQSLNLKTHQLEECLRLVKEDE